MRAAAFTAIACAAIGFAVGRWYASGTAPVNDDVASDAIARAERAASAPVPSSSRPGMVTGRVRQPRPSVPTEWEAYLQLDPVHHEREAAALAESLLGPWLEGPLRCRQRVTDAAARIELVLDLQTSPSAIDAYHIDVGTVEGDVPEEAIDCVRAALPPTLHVPRGELSSARPYRGPFTMNL